jgi:hypothetical protein
MLAVHFDNWIFLLLVAVAMLFRWLSAAAGKASKNSDETPGRSTSPPPPVPRGPMDSDAERIRKFLEALGQPPEAKPPPPVAHRTDMPPRPVAPVRPPAGPLPFPPKAPRPLSREDKGRRAVILQESPIGPPAEWTREAKVMVPVESATPPVPESSAIESPSKPLPRPVEAYAIATPASPAAAKIDIVSLLDSAKGLREAIILREIFGPPRSLQPLDLVGSA